MGATVFEHFIKTTKDPKAAFREAREQSQWEHGHGGYSGTLAEKHDYVMIGKAETTQAARKLADRLIEAHDARIKDKWGPAGCIETPEGFLFFGWASS